MVTSVGSLMESRNSSVQVLKNHTKIENVKVFGKTAFAPMVSDASLDTPNQTGL
jgi:hypothetical protein